MSLTGRMNTLKPNYVGIVGGILAFISLILAWWTVTFSYSGLPISVDASLYLYQFTAVGISLTTSIPWYCWVTLALIVVGGVLGIVGSVTKFGKRFIAVGGALALLSIIVFAAGFQVSGLPFLGISGLGFFSSGTLTLGSLSVNYSSYLSFGFWIALFSAIVLFIAIRMHPKEEIAPPPPSPMPQQPPPEAPPPPGT